MSRMSHQTFPEGRRRAECNCIAGAVADGPVKAGDPIRCAACTRSRNMNEHEATVNARRNDQAMVGGTIVAERCQKPVSTLSSVLQIRDSTVLCLSREGDIAVPGVIVWRAKSPHYTAIQRLFTSPQSSLRPRARPDPLRRSRGCLARAANRVPTPRMTSRPDARRRATPVEHAAR